jgi:hypothetical protein
MVSEIWLLQFQRLQQQYQQQLLGVEQPVQLRVTSSSNLRTSATQHCRSRSDAAVAPDAIAVALVLLGVAPAGAGAIMSSTCRGRGNHE